MMSNKWRVQNSAWPTARAQDHACYIKTTKERVRKGTCQSFRTQLSVNPLCSLLWSPEPAGPHPLLLPLWLSWAYLVHILFRDPPEVLWKQNSFIFCCYTEYLILFLLFLSFSLTFSTFICEELIFSFWEQSITRKFRLKHELLMPILDGLWTTKIISYDST